tara:strand:- start:1163 stop:1645 length:483 start_codon:yes stop_codon:yes gene_type:complete
MAAFTHHAQIFKSLDAEPTIIDITPVPIHHSAVHPADHRKIRRTRGGCLYRFVAVRGGEAQFVDAMEVAVKTAKIDLSWTSGPCGAGSVGWVDGNSICGFWAQTPAAAQNLLSKVVFDLRSKGLSNGHGKNLLLGGWYLGHRREIRESDTAENLAPYRAA